VDQAQLYASGRLASGDPAERIVADLVASGWSPDLAWSLLSSVNGGRAQAGPPVQPVHASPQAQAPQPIQPLGQPQRPTLTRGSTAWWLVLVSVLAGVAFVVVTIVVFFSVFTAPGGPRGVLAQFTDGGLPIGLYLAITVPLWLVSLVTLLLARARWRSELGGVRPRSSLGAWAWFFVIGNPVIAALAAALTFILGLALGIMCGEAVSESCGTGL
jgi:hypothetical protein